MADIVLNTNVAGFLSLMNGIPSVTLSKLPVYLRQDITLYRWWFKNKAVGTGGTDATFTTTGSTALSEITAFLNKCTLANQAAMRNSLKKTANRHLAYAAFKYGRRIKNLA
ncbi:MAG: hypothetical protein EBS53_05705 [Bacteroidetes bacterium]|nr:hypothetical protein [Bacteroidota bacterium]